MSFMKSGSDGGRITVLFACELDRYLLYHIRCVEAVPKVYSDTVWYIYVICTYHGSHLPMCRFTTTRSANGDVQSMVAEKEHSCALTLDYLTQIHESFNMQNI
jgi:hypothetical protein